MLFLWSFSLLRYSLCPLDRLICVASLLWFLEHDLPTSSASFTLPSYCAFLEVDPSSSLPSILWVLVSMRQFCVRHLVLPDSWKTTCPLPSCLVFSSVLINPTFHILFTSFLLLARYQSCPLLAFRFLFSLDQLNTLPPFRFFHARCQCWLFTLEVFILCASAFKLRMLLECCNTRVATSCNFPFFSTKQHQGTDTLNDRLLRDSIQLSLQFNPKLISSLLVLWKFCQLN